MKEEQIKKNIKVLQDDISYAFKQTSEIIDIIYRRGVNDQMKSNDVTPVKENTPKENTPHKRFEGQKLTEDILNKKIKKAKRDVYFEILSLIENKQDLLDVYYFVKDKCIEFGEDGVTQDKRKNRINNMF